MTMIKLCKLQADITGYHAALDALVIGCGGSESGGRYSVDSCDPKQPFDKTFCV